MAHQLKAIITKDHSLNEFADRHALHTPITLTHGFEMVALRDEDICRIFGVATIEETVENESASPVFIAALTELSKSMPFAYIETEYFGGEGTQFAFVFRDGVQQRVKEIPEGSPINDALAFMGLNIEPGSKDGFDTLGLGRYRSVEAWIKASKPLQNAQKPASKPWWRFWN